MTALVRRELRALFLQPAPWVLLALAGPLAWWSLRSALARYAAAAGDDTLEGVVVPVLGALAATTALGFPFVVARALGADKKNATLLFVTQLGHRPLAVVVAKAVALACAFALSALPPLCAVLAFAAAGGHVHAPSLLAVLAGYALYAAVVVGAGTVAVGVTDGVAAAALGTLAVVAVLRLVVDGMDASSAWPKLATFAPTAVLRTLERGVVDVHLAGVLAVVAGGLLAAGALLLAPAAALEKKLVRAVVVIVVTAALAAGVAQVKKAVDVSEGRRNSFPRAVESELARIGDPIRVTVRLRAQDPRSTELDRAVLGPLARAAAVDVKRVDVDDRTYGLITYQVGTRASETRATSPQEVVPLVLELAGLKSPALVADDIARPHPFHASVPLAIPLTWLWTLVGLGGLLLTRRSS